MHLFTKLFWPKEIKIIYSIIDEINDEYLKNQWEYSLYNSFEKIVYKDFYKSIGKTKNIKLLQIIDEAEYSIKSFVEIQVCVIIIKQINSWVYHHMWWLNSMSDWPILVNIFNKTLKNIEDRWDVNENIIKSLKGELNDAIENTIA